MKHGRWLAALLGVLLWGVASRADITNTTPYDYDQPPAPGKEQGTYMAAATGSFGPDCFFTAIRHRDGQVPPEPGRLRRQALHQDQRRAEREWPGLRVQALRDHARGHHGRLHLQRRWHVV